MLNWRHEDRPVESTMTTEFSRWTTSTFCSTFLLLNRFQKSNVVATTELFRSFFSSVEDLEFERRCSIRHDETELEIDSLISMVRSLWALPNCHCELCSTEFVVFESLANWFPMEIFLRVRTKERRVVKFVLDEKSVENFRVRNRKSLKTKMKNKWAKTKRFETNEPTTQLKDRRTFSFPIDSPNFSENDDQNAVEQRIDCLWSMASLENLCPKEPEEHFHRETFVWSIKNFAFSLLWKQLNRIWTNPEPLSRLKEHRAVSINGPLH